MDVKFYNFKHYFEERNIANMPWVIALKRRKVGLKSSLDVIATSQCPHRSEYHLKDIDHADRSPTERDT